MEPPRIPKILHALLRGIFLILEALSSLIYPLIYEDVKRLPPLREEDMEILTSSAVDLAHKIKDGSLKSRTVVQAFISRAKSVHALLNAYVDTRFEDALSEADAVDGLIQDTPLPERYKLFQGRPFLGVPFTTKDSVGVCGLRQTLGLVCRRDKVATEDAPCVANLRKAGGILLGLTNVPELCMWMESANNVYGRTNNPYHLGRIPGGSSGGEAAAIASASSPFGIGSDIGGSIRMPAFFCGIFGHKCSTGEPVSNSGQLPPCNESTNSFLSTGPMTRHSKDLLPAFKALIANEEIIQTRLRLSEPVDLSSLKIYCLKDYGISGFPLMSKLSEELYEAQSGVVRDLECELGLPVENLELEEFYWSFNIWNQKMNAEPDIPSFTQLLNDAQQPPISPWMELLKWMCFKSTNYTLISIVLAIFTDQQSSGGIYGKEFMALCDSLREKLKSILGNDGILLFPSHPIPAPYHGEPLLKALNCGYTAIFNVLGLPVTQIPLGISSKTRTPLGLQLVAGQNQDRLTLALATEIERIRGGQLWKHVY